MATLSAILGLDPATMKLEMRHFLEELAHVVQLKI